MKKLLVSVLVVIAVTGTTKVNAQLKISVNIGSQPAWGPAGYDHVDYYYLPDIEAYYYVPKKQFIYQSRGKWIYSSSLPPAYRNYDLYSGYKVVANEPAPFNHFKEYQAKYGSFKNNHSQEIIRTSHDNRYQKAWKNDYKVKGNDHWKKYGNNNNGNNGHH